MKHIKIYKLLGAFLMPVLVSGCAAVIIGGAGAAGVAGANIGGSSVSLHTSVTDIQIKAKALSIIRKYCKLKEHVNIEITVFNHIVLILGQVPNKNIQNDIATDMAKIPGVLKVFDQATIGPTASFSDYTEDSWITTKIISTLLSEGINSAKFKIITGNDIVYMMGVVSKSEGDQASKIASQVSGVKKVVNLYSYVNQEANSSVTHKKDGTEKHDTKSLNQ